MKLDDLTKKEFPAQSKARLQWQLDAIRANQVAVAKILKWLVVLDIPSASKDVLDKMHKHDRDAILQSGGILTDKQIKVLKG